MLPNYYIFHTQHNTEGICFKNAETYEGERDEICYISEYGITELSQYENEDVPDWVIQDLKDCGAISTHNSILQRVHERIDEFVTIHDFASKSEEEIARMVFNELQWESADTCIDQMCWW